MKEDKEKTVEELTEELSWKIFNKPSKDIKYLLVTNYIHTQLIEEEMTRTGLYQWINVFNGEIKYPREIIDYNNYDIVQVNLSAQDMYLVGTIREQLNNDGKTKLVANNDYTTEMWSRSFEYHPTFTRELQYADMIFGTEYFQTTALTEMSQRKCFVIPHPADVRRLKASMKKTKKPIISTIWRRYDNHAYIPSLAVKNHGLTTQLIGYDKQSDPKTYLTTTLYDYVLSATNYLEFCGQMAESTVVYDPFTFHSYSRATVDTAALGVPVVGTNRTQSMNVCYPYTCVDPYDVKKARELIKKLLNDKEFNKKVVDTALNNVEFYNHANSKLRYLVSLNESLEDKNEKVKPLKRTEIVRGSGDDVLDIIAQEKTIQWDEKTKKKLAQKSK